MLENLSKACESWHYHSSYPNEQFRWIIDINFCTVFQSGRPPINEQWMEWKVEPLRGEGPTFAGKTPGHNHKDGLQDAILATMGWLKSQE